MATGKVGQSRGYLSGKGVTKEEEERLKMVSLV